MNLGCLYVAATPIGNLGDISHRLTATLSEVDHIVCEDTRLSKKICFHLGIQKTMIALHDANELVASQKALESLQAGKNIALITDAGTPAISDPGAILVNLCHQNNIKVCPIPGPSALAAAASVSGFIGCSFKFYGFLPRSGAARKTLLKDIASSYSAALFFEAPNRVGSTLEALAKHLDPNRLVLIARELTKVHEQIERKSIAQWLVEPPMAKGEFAIAIAPLQPESKDEKLLRRYQFYKASNALKDVQIFELLAYEFDTAAKRIRYKIERLNTN